uniref:Remorin_N domain-containing protein n=1 Tax=Caenorhabditis tropicalis TaxID=1561998 RepID=A0A1I7UNX6_9PELO
MLKKISEFISRLFSGEEEIREEVWIPMKEKIMDREEEKDQSIEKTEKTVIVVQKAVHVQAPFFIPTAPIQIPKIKETLPLTEIDELKISRQEYYEGLPKVKEMKKANRSVADWTELNHSAESLRNSFR